MSLKFIAKSLLVLSFASPLAFANTAVRISCPGVDKIQASAEKIDAAEKYQDMFVAYTSSPAFFEGSRPWIVAAGNLHSASVSEAIAEGKNAVARTSSRDTDYAIDADQGLSYCVYAGGSVISVTMSSAKAGLGKFFNKI